VDTWDAIRSRRNVRAYDGRPIEPAALEQILEAARRAPSSRNQQAWDFVVVTERDRLRKLSEVWRFAQHVASSAATVALVAPESAVPDARETFQFDLGQAAMSLMVAAADQGIGSCHAAVEDQPLAREVLGLPDDRECMWLIALGFPADRPLAPVERPSRRPFDDVVHRERW
jgi:nitroreductase